jgi:hypothetical protein
LPVRYAPQSTRFGSVSPKRGDFWRIAYTLILYCRDSPRTSSTLHSSKMTSEASDTSAAGSPPPADKLISSSKTSDKTGSKTKKRSDSSATDPNSSAKVTKRRAARACVSCRARKVRCNVVEESPCTNCRFDNVECVVQESRRRKKHLLTTSNSNVGQQTQQRGSAEAQPPLRSSSSSAANHPIPITSAAELQRPSSGSPISSSDVDTSMMANGSAGGGTGSDGHMPHMLCEYSNSLFPFFGLN